MEGVKYLTIITNREFGEKYLEFFREYQTAGILAFFANGTAGDATLDYFGIEKTEKVVFNLMVRDSVVDEIKQGLKSRMNISAAGNGIAVFVPIDGIGGSSAKKYLLGEDPIEKGEKSMDVSTSKQVLIVTIADKGNTETVMDAARGAGATGGTTVRAKGTGAEIAKFFGVSISEEKEMIYIVATRDMRDQIMHAIMEKAGKDTPAHGITFSLPVDGVIGIGSME